jgi:hypothetical protein
VAERHEHLKTAENSLDDKRNFRVKAMKFGLVSARVARGHRQDRQRAKIANV